MGSLKCLIFKLYTLLECNACKWQCRKSAIFYFTDSPRLGYDSSFCLSLLVWRMLNDERRCVRNRKSEMPIIDHTIELLVCCVAEKRSTCQYIYIFFHFVFIWENRQRFKVILEHLSNYPHSIANCFLRPKLIKKNKNNKEGTFLISSI